MAQAPRLKPGPAMSSTQPIDLIVGGCYRLMKKLGEGSFGVTYLARHMSNQEDVAVKLESKSCRHPQLLYESKLYQRFRGGIGIAEMRWFGTEKEYNAMVIDLLGPSLEDLFGYCSRRFSIKTILMLADQMICRIEYIHSKDFIHRDIKPDNFLMGTGRCANRVLNCDT